MASSIVSWCASDQNILLQAPERGRRVRAVERVGQRPVPVDLHDLDLRPRPGQPLAGQSDRGHGRFARASSRISSNSFWKRRCPVVDDVPRSNPSVVMATFHPLFTPPMTLSLGQRTLVKKTSLNSAEPSICSIGPHLDAGLLHRHEEVGDAGVLGHVRVGAGQEEDVVGVLRLGRPHLLPVDHPFVTVELGPCLEAGQVRAGVGLAEALAPRDLPFEDARDELLLLLLGAPLQDGRADQRVAEEVGAQRGARPGELLVEHHLLQQAQPLSAVLGGPAGADPPAGEELLPSTRR